MTDFQQADQRRYLRMDSSQIGAADQIRRWRAHCRNQRRPAVTVIAIGSSFHLEIRSPSWWPAHPQWEAFTALPGMNYASSHGSGHEINIHYLSQASEESLLGLVFDVLDSYAGEELRLARRDLVAALPPSETIPFCHTFSLESRSYQTARPAMIPEVLPDWEYQVLSAGLEHLLGVLPGPIPLAAWAVYGDWNRNEERLAARFPGLDGPFLRNLGNYLWENRFLPKLVELQQDGAVQVSRPGRLDDQAIFWLAGDTLTEHFRGFLHLELSEGRWRVVDRSYDEDWGDTILDGCLRGPRSFFAERPDPAWKKVHLAYPQAHPLAFPAEALADSDQFYKELIEVRGDPALLDLENLPSLHGPTYSWRQLAILARDRQELFWDFEPSQVSRRLASMGYPVLAMQEAPASTWKLLAHLDETLPCRQASLSWLEPGPSRLTPRQKGIVEIIDRIVARAGCSSLTFAVAADIHDCALQSPGEPLARRLPRTCVFEQKGVVWMSVRDHAFDPGIFDIVSELCQWGDPEGRWLRPLWKAAVIELARLEESEF